MSTRPPIGNTHSLCPVCFTPLKAERVMRGDDLFLEKNCPAHGPTSAIIWRGTSPSYEDWDQGETGAGPGVFQRESVRGCPMDCGLCPEHAAPTCTVLMEVTERCNLGCPICFARSTDNRQPDTDMATIKSMLGAVIRAGGPYPLQISGGEPTVRDDLPEIVALAKSYGFPHVQINTNGLRIGSNPDFLSDLKEAGTDLIYLQLDGVSDEVYRTIRGRELADRKISALDNCSRLQIGVQLVPTLIRGTNDHELGAIIDLAKDYMPTVKGVHFQPMSYFGRYHSAPSNDVRMTTPDVLHGLEEQTGGEVAVAHFIPRRKHDSHCGFSAYYVLGKDGRLKATTRFSPKKKQLVPLSMSPAEHVRDFITKKSRFIEEPPPCECTQAATTTNLLSRANTHGLSVTGMPFMDAWTLDLERLRNCCVHVIRNDGRMIPFCSNYLTNTCGQRLPGIDEKLK